MAMEATEIVDNGLLRDSGLQPPTELAESVTVVVCPLHRRMMDGADRSRTIRRPVLGGALC